MLKEKLYKAIYEDGDYCYFRSISLKAAVLTASYNPFIKSVEDVEATEQVSENEWRTPKMTVKFSEFFGDLSVYYNGEPNCIIATFKPLEFSNAIKYALNA